MVPQNWRQTGRYRESQITGVETHEGKQKGSVGASDGTETWTVTDGVLEAQCEKVWDLKIPGGPSHQEAPHFCEFYIQELHLVLTVNIRQKFPHASGRVRGKGTILHMPDFLFLTRPSFKRNY